MSIIIRLQNLPWSARSGDIRHFFGGLRIPDGGVHIIGGEKGDAFIAFNSDEDARLAMRKDGGKIKDTRIKLLLSSHMEMQHVIEQVTKQPFPKPPRSESEERQRSPEEIPRKESRSRSPERRRRSSPRSSSNRSQHRSREEVTRVNRGQKRSCSPRRRSISPPVKKIDDRILSSYPSDLRKEPRDARVVPPSANDDLFSQQSWRKEQAHEQKRTVDLYDRRSPPKERQYFDENNRPTLFPNMSGNRFPESISTFDSFLKNEVLNVERNRDMKFNAGNMNKDVFLPDRNAHVEDPLYNMQGRESPFTGRKDYGHKMDGDERKVFHDSQPKHSDFPPFQQDKSFDNFYGQQKFDHSRDYGHHTQHDSEEPYNRLGHTNLAMPPPPPFPLLSSLPGEQNREIVKQESRPVPESFCVEVIGLNPRASFRDVQTVLKGIYAPHNNIQWELDNRNRKTGVAFVKLSNKEDFIGVLEGNYFLEDKKIEVRQCPEYISCRYFPAESERSNVDISRQQLLDGFCYMLKGLPFSVSYNDITVFFKGLRIADMFIIYEENGKATGTGYIEFFDERDFISAMRMNGKKIAHRYIELLPSTKMDIKKVKEKYGEREVSNVPNSQFIKDKPFPDHQAPRPQHSVSNRRPLCALLTGLSPTIHYSQIFDLFEESGIKPFAIHIMLNNKRHPKGRAFVEILNPLDFDTALKCHGKFIDNSMICVKQVLYDEMVKILDAQDASHHFGSQQIEKQSSKPQLNLPEKVPYLWEPPDDECDDLSPEPERETGREDNFIFIDDFESGEKSGPKGRGTQNYGQSTNFDFPRSTVQPKFSPKLSQVASERTDSFLGQQTLDSGNAKFWQQDKSLDKRIPTDSMRSHFPPQQDYELMREHMDTFRPDERDEEQVYEREKKFNRNPEKPHVNEIMNPNFPLQHHDMKNNMVQIRSDRRDEKGISGRKFNEESQQLHDESTNFPSQQHRDSIRQEMDNPRSDKRYEEHTMRNVKKEPEHSHKNQTMSFPPKQHHDLIRQERDNSRPDKRYEDQIKRDFKTEPEYPHVNQSMNFPSQLLDDSIKGNITNFRPGRRDEEQTNRNFKNEPEHSLVTQMMKFPPQQHDNSIREDTANLRLGKRDEEQVKRNFNKEPVHSHMNQMMNFPPQSHHDSTRSEMGNKRYEEQTKNNIKNESVHNQVIDFPAQSNLRADKRDKEPGYDRNFSGDATRSQTNQMTRFPPRILDSVKENISSFKPDRREGGQADNINFRTTINTSQIDITPVDIDESSRIPVKFEVKIKPPVTTSKVVDEAFGKELIGAEIKKKLSRLSPEKAADSSKGKVQLSAKSEKELKLKEDKVVKSEKMSSEEILSSKSNKPLPETKKSSRCESPKREKDNSKKVYSSSEKKTEKSIETDRSKDKGNQSSKETSRSNYEHLRDAERKTKVENDRHQRNSARSRSGHRSESSHSSGSSRVQGRDDRKEMSSRFVGGSDTVQLINVHPDIGLEEILDFFHEFDLRKDKIIRRYTDRGEPTGDVRVCFKSSRDAEKAMKTLNRHYLGGIPVEMFLV